ncbi:MAG: Na+/H+ antiporter NhaC family protein [Tissierellaceae bacterium]
MNYGWLSILPPIVAIILALITKEVISSLLIGIIAGGLILSSGNILDMLETIFDLMGNRVGENGLMIIFLALLGSLVMVINMAGGSFAYGKWASKKIKSKKAAKFATAILGIVIFIDDYFNCLTVGAVMKPIVDESGVSRAKLAHIIDSSAAPICILAPVSSWAASVVAIIGSVGIENPMKVFLATIPFNLYALLTIFIVIYFSFSDIEIGLMHKFEIEDTSIIESKSEVGYEHSNKGKVIDLIFPVLILIGGTIFFMLRTGGYFSGEGVSASKAFGDANVNLSLVIGSVIAIFVAFIMYIPRKLVSFEVFMNGLVEGMKSMIGAIVILTLAWTIGGITSADYLNTGGFIGSKLATSAIPMWIFPAIIFIVAAFLAFSTGTAWGTFGILIPIIVPILVHMNQMEYLIIVLASIFSGSVFGDHCSPISDTTILSSAGAGCNHIDHVQSQIPYALSAALASVIGFIAAGLTKSIVVTLFTSLICLLVIINIMKRYTRKKYDIEK